MDVLQIMNYDLKYHQGHMEDMLKARGLSVSEIKDLPELGFIVFSDNSVPVAAGFLRRCEGHLGILDGFITNPSVVGKVRNQALDILTEKIMQLAKEREITRLLALSVDQNTISRSMKFGFYSIGHTVVVKES